jgi:hypothetical protein
VFIFGEITTKLKTKGPRKNRKRRIKADLKALLGVKINSPIADFFAFSPPNDFFRFSRLIPAWPAWALPD